MTIQNKRLIGIILGVIFVLLIPLIAMQFTTEVNWDLTDFIVAGGLLLSTGLAIEFVLRKVPKPQHRVAIGIGIFIAFLLLWAELAVGILDRQLRDLKGKLF